MVIERKDISLSDIIYNQTHIDVKDNIAYFKKKVEEYVNNANKLIDEDFDKMTDEEFYNLICNMYDIEFLEKDCLKFISKKNGKKYDRFIDINTYMTYSDRFTSGKGINFGWETKWFRIVYHIAVSDDCNIEYDETISKEKLNKLITDKKIVIFNEKRQQLADEPEQKEDIENFPIIGITLSDVPYINELDIKNKDDFSVIISMLRKKFTKKRILKDMKKYIEDLQEQIDEVLTDYTEPLYEGLSQSCNEWFKNSRVKQKYLKLLDKFNINN